MPSITLVAVWALNEDSTVAETFGKHFSTDIIQANTFTWHSHNTAKVTAKHQ